MLPELRRQVGPLDFGISRRRSCGRVGRGAFRFPRGRWIFGSDLLGRGRLFSAGRRRRWRLLRGRSLRDWRSGGGSRRCHRCVRRSLAGVRCCGGLARPFRQPFSSNTNIHHLSPKYTTGNTRRISYESSGPLTVPGIVTDLRLLTYEGCITQLVFGVFLRQCAAGAAYPAAGARRFLAWNGRAGAG